MANIVLFDVQRGDVTLNSALLTRIRNGQFVLNLLGEQREVQFDATLANAVIAGATSIKCFHSSHGHRSLTQQVFNALT